MGRWTVQQDNQVLVIESTSDGEITIGTTTGEPFVTDRAGARDARSKLGLAIGDPLPDARERT